MGHIAACVQLSNPGILRLQLGSGAHHADVMVLLEDLTRQGTSSSQTHRKCSYNVGDNGCYYYQRPRGAQVTMLQVAQ
jgi:hypothetical protein